MFKMALVLGGHARPGGTGTGPDELGRPEVGTRAARVPGWRSDGGVVGVIPARQDVRNPADDAGGL